MRKPMIAGNWKMHCPPREAEQLATAIVQRLSGDAVEVVIAPPFVSLSAVSAAIKGSTVRLAAQNVATQDQGAYTGEVSAPMLQQVGVEYVIVGHSERRQLFGETDALINSKVLRLCHHHLAVILCIGETLEQREKGLALEVCQQQLRDGLMGVEAGSLAQIVVAYEPIWAIGTGRSASSQDAQEVQRGCRDYLARLYSHQAAEGIRILYGGSVKPDNISALMMMPDVDGALVGGASLDPDSFIKLVNYRK